MNGGNLVYGAWKVTATEINFSESVKCGGKETITDAAIKWKVRCRCEVINPGSRYTCEWMRWRY